MSGPRGNSIDTPGATADASATPGLGAQDTEASDAGSSAIGASEIRAAPTVEAGGSHHVREIVDVWSWTERKYRIRATTLLFVNLLLFCGLCVFTNWLRTARALDFSGESYYTPFRFWDEGGSLYDLMRFPISVDQTPIHGIVIGLLIASIVAVPISVSILYRFRSGLPFIAAVLVFAHMPWMAVTLLCSCVLASIKPFRMRFRFGSALLAMLPVMVYLFLATRGPDVPLSATTPPERRLLHTAPWLLAILAACTMMAVTIFIARMVNYRPGAVAPVMAVMFATPAILFHGYVGMDELVYRGLEFEYGPRSSRLEPVQDVSDRVRTLLTRWTDADAPLSREDALVLLAGSDGNDAPRRRLIRRFVIDLMDDRQAAYAAAKDFIADHPTSRYVPNALFMQARALDTRIDPDALLTHLRRELYADFPHVESEPIWTSLLTQYPHSPLAVAARLRVAQLRLRRGDADGALAALAQPVNELGDQFFAASTARPLLRAQPPEYSLGYDPDEDLFESRRLRELILANRLDAKYGGRPLQLFVGLDPNRSGYADQLRLLASEYADSLLHDNIVVRWASVAAEPREERARRLEACIARFPDGDAMAQALFELAAIEVSAQAGTDPEARQRGAARLQTIIARFPRSCWATRAAERLRMLGSMRPVTTRPTE